MPKTASASHTLLKPKHRTSARDRTIEKLVQEVQQVGRKHRLVKHAVPRVVRVRKPYVDRAVHENNVGRHIPRIPALLQLAVAVDDEWPVL